MFGIDDILIGAGIAAIVGLFVWGCVQIFNVIKEAFNTWKNADIIHFYPKEELKKAARYNPNLRTVLEAFDDDDTGVFVEENHEDEFHFRRIQKSLDDEVNPKGYYAERGNPEKIYTHY